MSLPLSEDERQMLLHIGAMYWTPPNRQGPWYVTRPRGDLIFPQLAKRGLIVLTGGGHAGQYDLTDDGQAWVMAHREELVNHSLTDELTAAERQHLEEKKQEVRVALAEADVTYVFQLFEEEDRPIVGHVIRRELEAEGYRVEVDHSRLNVTRGRRHPFRPPPQGRC